MENNKIAMESGTADPGEHLDKALRHGANELPASDSASLESILCTEELKRRPSRPPDYETENRALTALAQALADSPGTILQTLADVILETLHVGSAGSSLLTEDGRRFYWPSIAGVWRQHTGGGTPREFGPCGDVLDCNIPLLFKRFERRYRLFAAGESTLRRVPVDSVLRRGSRGWDDLGNGPR